MMEFTLDYASLAEKLENQELESPEGHASPQVYGQLLAIYLLFNDLTSAKFLWKRIPTKIKAANQELSTIWSVGKLMWKRNYSEIYSVIRSAPSWPNHLKNIMNMIAESIRERSISLINKAYSVISITEAASLLGLSKEDTIQMGNKYGWTCDAEQNFFEIPKNGQGSDKSNYSNSGIIDNGTELLTKFTDYILFLENSAIKVQK